MNDQLYWFATRGAGVVSLLLFTAVMCIGILTTMRWQSHRWPRFLTAELHRSLALMSVVFLGFHIVTAIVDPFTNLGLAAALIPFASEHMASFVRSRGPLPTLRIGRQPYGLLPVLPAAWWKPRENENELQNLVSMLGVLRPF